MDVERLSAEKRAVDLGADPEIVSDMSDYTLRLTLFELSRPEIRFSQKKLSVLADLEARTGIQAGPLLEELGLQVAEDGLIEVEQITDIVRQVIGDLPVAFYHHTSTALLPKIKEDGLLVGKQTNFFNTQAGVYVSTISAGQPVAIYSSRAAKVHGGDPTTIRLRRTLDQVSPDPDDADLEWAQGKQFITPNVPPSDLILESEEVESECHPVRESQRG